MNNLIFETDYLNEHLKDILETGQEYFESEITKKMIQKGYSTEKITEITGFEIEKIEALRAELKI